jgi:hypothetical protein
VTITPEPNYSFYVPLITEAHVKDRFTKGKPEVVLTSVAKKKIVVTLTYKVTAKTIVWGNGLETASTVFAGFWGVNGEGNPIPGALKLGPLVVEDLVSHNQEAPVALRVNRESSYYSLSQPVVWKEGLSGKTFFGGNTAVAEVTIPAKPGYTFDGTTIANSNLSAFFSVSDAPATAEIISAGDKLVFNVSYFVPKTEITREQVTANITKLAVPVIGVKASSKVEFNSKNPYFTGSTITWDGVNNTSLFVAGQAPTATVTLLAKPGYEFGGDINIGRGDITVVSVIEDPDELNLGNKLVIKVVFPAPAALVSTSATLPGIVLTNPVYPSIVHLQSAAIAPTFTGADQVLGTGEEGSEFEWIDGTRETDDDVIFDRGVFNGKVRAELVLKPNAGYTFAGATPQNITAYRGRIRTGLTADTVVPEIDSVVVEGNDLKVTLYYDIAPAIISSLTMGATNASLTGDIIYKGPASSAVVTIDPASPNPQVAGIGTGSTFTWGTDGVDASGKFDVTEYGGTVKATAVLKPYSGNYTFTGITINSTLVTTLTSIFTLNGSIAPDTINP